MKAVSVYPSSEIVVKKASGPALRLAVAMVRSRCEMYLLSLCRLSSHRLASVRIVALEAMFATFQVSMNLLNRSVERAIHDDNGVVRDTARRIALAHQKMISAASELQEIPEILIDEDNPIYVTDNSFPPMFSSGGTPANQNSKHLSENIN